METIFNFISGVFSTLFWVVTVIIVVAVIIVKIGCYFENRKLK